MGALDRREWDSVDSDRSADAVVAKRRTRWPAPRAADLQAVAAQAPVRANPGSPEGDRECRFRPNAPQDTRPSRVRFHIPQRAAVGISRQAASRRRLAVNVRLVAASHAPPAHAARCSTGKRFHTPCGVTLVSDRLPVVGRRSERRLRFHTPRGVTWSPTSPLSSSVSG